MLLEYLVAPVVIGNPVRNTPIRDANYLKSRGKYSSKSLPNRMTYCLLSDVIFTTITIR